MSVSVHIHDGPIVPPNEPRCQCAGAVVVFEGIVREMESGRRISGLHYQTYDPMAHRELQRLAQEIMKQFELLDVTVAHSRGFVAVGRCSLRVAIAAMHRKPALAAMDGFIDALKRDVPIWKNPVWIADPASAPGVQS